MKKTLLSIIAVFAFVSMLLMGVKTEASSRGYNWGRLEVSYAAFIENPDVRYKNDLLRNLPSRPVAVKNKGQNTINFIFKNIDGLARMADNGDELAIQILLKLNNLTDGARSETLAIMIGRTITKHPVQFLNALEKNLDCIRRLDVMLGSLGEEYTDEIEKSTREFEQRYMKIRDAKGGSERLKRLCLYVLSEQINQNRKDLIDINNEQALLKKHTL